MTTLSVFEEEAVGLEDLPELEKKDLVVLSSFDVGHAFLPMVRTEAWEAKPAGTIPSWWADGRHGDPPHVGGHPLGGLSARGCSGSDRLDDKGTLVAIGDRF